MIRLMPARLTPSSWDSRCTSRSSATSRGLYRRPPPAVRPGLTSPSLSYWRSVWACMPASSAATEMTKTGASSATARIPSGVSRPEPGALMRPPRRRSPAPSAELLHPWVSSRARSPCTPGPDRGGDLRPRVLVELLGEGLQRLALGGGEPGRHRDLDGDQQVTRAALAADAAAAHPQRAPARGAGRHLERHVAVERRHGQRRAQRRLGEGDRHGEGEVVTLAAEQLVLGDVDDDEQVAGRPAAAAGRALAGQPDALAVLHPGGDPHRDGAGLRGDAAAGAGRARVVDHLAGAAAVAARLGKRERPLAAAGDPGALAHRAGVRRRARPGATAGAGRAGARALHAQRHGHAEDRLVERERGLGLDVLPARRAGRGLAAGAGVPTAAGVAEEPTEQVAEPAAAAAAGTGLAEQVVEV